MSTQVPVWQEHQCPVLVMVFSVMEMRYVTRQPKVAEALETPAKSGQAVMKEQISANLCAAMAFVIQEKTALSARVTVLAEQAAAPVAVASREPATAYVIPIKKILPVRIAGHPIVAEMASVRGKKTIQTAQ